jgi:hypothetical protein
MIAPACRQDLSKTSVTPARGNKVGNGAAGEARSSAPNAGEAV